MSEKAAKPRESLENYCFKYLVNWKENVKKYRGGSRVLNSTVHHGMHFPKQTNI